MLFFWGPITWWSFLANLLTPVLTGAMFVVEYLDGPGDELVRSLSWVVDGVLQELAPRGIEGERLRRLTLGLEREPDPPGWVLDLYREAQERR